MLSPSKKKRAILPTITPMVVQEGFRFIDRTHSCLRVFPLVLLALACIGLTLLVAGAALLAGIPWFDYDNNSVFDLLILLAWPLFLIVLLASMRFLLVKKLGPAELTLSHWPLRLGQELEFVFRQPVKQRARVERVEIRLVYSEVVTYWSDQTGLFDQPGEPSPYASHPWLGRLFFKDRRTDQHTHQIPLLALKTSIEPTHVEAQGSMCLPPEVPASFSIPYNAIEWHIEIIVVLPAAPDSVTRFPLLVLPEVVA